MISIDYDRIIEAVKSTKSIVLDESLRNQIKMKGEADYVTEVDLQISNYLKKELLIITPEIGFMSEEDEKEFVSTRWILDPIDGTTNLVYGYNICSVSLALCVNEVIEFGVVYNPFNDDLFVGFRGNGAFYNGKKLPAISDRELKNCLIEFGAGSTGKQHADTAFEIAKTVFKSCLDLRRICSSALTICYVASGRINGYFEKELKPWDYAAAGLILRECGGQMSDWSGQEIKYILPTSLVCGSKKAYDFLLSTIQSVDS